MFLPVSFRPVKYLHFCIWELPKKLKLRKFDKLVLGWNLFKVNVWLGNESLRYPLRLLSGLFEMLSFLNFYNSRIFLRTLFNTAPSAHPQILCVGGCWDRTQDFIYCCGKGVLPECRIIAARRPKHKSRLWATISQSTS